METRTAHDNTAKGWFAMSSDPTHNPSSTELQFETELQRDLYEALKLLDEWATHHAVDAPEWRDKDTVKIQVSIGELRNAVAALAKARGEQTEQSDG